MSFCLIILAGGNSHRFKSNIGKPYQKLAGKSLIEINVIKASKFKQIKKIILVYNKKDLKRVKSLKLRNIKLILGGKNRQQSAFKALKYLNNIKGITKVLIHDVARPNFSLKLFVSIIRNMRNARAVVPKINIPDAEISFLKLSSYDGLSTTGNVNKLIGLSKKIEGRNVIVLEDIIDTGITLEKIISLLEKEKVNSIKIATLLFKPNSYQKKFQIDYIGKSIENDFVVGYGLDYDEKGRNLKNIYKLKN